MKRPKLIDAFPTLLTTGAFMTSLTVFSREDIKLSAANAGIAYALQHSGQKDVSSLVEHYLDDDGVVTAAGITAIGALLEQYYGDNWSKLLDAFLAEYNPIENYNRVEEWSDTKSGTDTLTDDIASKQDTHLYGSKQNTNQYGQKQNTNQYGQEQLTDALGQDQVTHVMGARHGVDVTEKYAEDGGYANDTRVTRDENSVTDTDTTAQRTDTHTKAQHTDTLTEATHTDTITEGTHTDTFTEGSHKDTHETEYDSTNEHEGHITGNIGTMSTQDMIQQEWTVRQKDFFNKMFNDIDEFLCVGCY